MKKSYAMNAILLAGILGCAIQAAGPGSSTATPPTVAGASPQAAGKPNVVVMMVDNLGWGELGCYGGGILRGTQTRRLDQLASEGIRFLNFNVEPQCTPSRSAFMTGRHPIRSGTTKVVWGMLYGNPYVPGRN